MSDVTNVILTFGFWEDYQDVPDGRVRYAPMAPINAWLVEHEHTPFGPDAAAMNVWEKGMETHVYLAAFNHLDLPAFLAMLAGLPWNQPKDVQIFLQPQHAEHFQVCAFWPAMCSRAAAP